MKILGVKFKNINSLAGEWEIRFDRSPISDAGLFAIVGPNGSGKSSILDAITLGLYGETARLRNPVMGLLNLREKESYSEVTFSVMDHPYSSRWSVQQAGENPEPFEMSLFSLNGEKTLLESRSIPVRNRIAELTGLDFKRFCRSILLAQGEFSAFLNALENERVEILEKIIGPEMLRELEASIRTRAERETERLHRLKEEAAGFQTPDSVRLEALRQSMEQAGEDIREIGRELEVLREMETWLERMAQEPTAGQNAADALVVAETRYAEVQESLQLLEQARPAEIYRQVLTDMEARIARAEVLDGEGRQLASQLPAREERIIELTMRLDGTRKELEAARVHLAARTGVFLEAERMDHDIAETGDLFLETVSRLEANGREQQDTVRMRAEQEETERSLDLRSQDLLQWTEAHAGEENLEAEIPAMESYVVQLIAIRQEKETSENSRGEALKAENRAAKALRYADAAIQKVRSKADRLRARKTDRDGCLLAVYGDETADSLKAGIDLGIKKLAACKALVRIGRKVNKDAAFKNVREEHAENKSRMATLSEIISTERSRLLALEGQIRQRDTVRRFDPDRGMLEPGEPCPLCGASAHPFLDNGGLDFTELDRIVREREENIRSRQIEIEALQAKDTVLQGRINAIKTVQQEWDSQCMAAGEVWAFGHIHPPSERIRTLRKEVRTARSKLRSAWWFLWRVKWTDSSLGRKLEKLSKLEKVLELASSGHETRQKALVQIDDDLKRLGENENSVRSALSGCFQRWQEPLPDPGIENLTVSRLKERLELFRRKRMEQTTAADELQLFRTRRQVLSEALERLEASSQHLSAESETIQARLHALKAEREARYGGLNPVHERRTLESRVESLSSEDRSLAAEVDALRQGLAADHEVLQRLADQALQARNEAKAAERDILERSDTAGFGSLDVIRDKLAILQGEQEIMSRLQGAETALTAAREALAALQPKYATQDSLETIRRKITDAIKRQKEFEQDIDGGEHTLENYRLAERQYCELLQAIAVQEKAYAEAMETHRSVDGQGDAGANLQQLLLTQLLEETNRHLTLLSSGRYTLKPAAENGLGLHVEDALQAMALRSVKTLSGGESFLVSLCLALGLSDMAGQHRKIESLFLDEGFGVLDEEMLYKVMSALKGLRANGKTIGIVSHVKRLAEEIPTQIRLEKGPDGFSRITVVA
jgi:DNA repair protein SbcC/Rad50